MDIEFHYWITGLVARKAGFSEEEARTIAYASQFTDDNDRILEVQDRSGKDEPYKNFISQTMNIFRPMHRLMHIYPVFHFLPGDPQDESARRRDGKMHLLNTTPGSDLAVTLLKAAFQAPEETRLYRIGIASHAFADSWAHQNFVGFKDSFNGMTLNPLPNIGHADFLGDPDMVGHIWDDPRLVESQVDNNHRFKTAACALLISYCEQLEGGGVGDDLGKKISELYDELSKLWGSSRRWDPLDYKVSQPGRIDDYADKLPWLPPYDEKAWLKESVDIEINVLEDSYKEGVRSALTLFPDRYYWQGPKEETPWYRFQEAVKDHQRLALSLMKDRYESMGLDARYWSVSESDWG